MNTNYCLQSIKEKIRAQLDSVVDADYIYLDLPYYSNVGDVLIWMGTKMLLEELSYKCLYSASIETYKKVKLKKDTVILLQGGGNFGDLWRRHTDFLLKVLSDYPDNKVVLMPQSVYYNDKELMQEDARIIAGHSNFMACVRDKASFDFLQKHFNGLKVKMVPDMAFYLYDSAILKKYINKRNQYSRPLLMKRSDKECAEYCFQNYTGDLNDVNVEDWPSMDSYSPYEKLRKFLSALNRELVQSKLSPLIRSVFDIYAKFVYMPHLYRQGVKFISSYRVVYSTRLHGALLALLLGKTVYLFDNSYGKNSGVYTAWLEDCEAITLISFK